MMSLWEKESNNNDKSLYTDLFPTIDNDYISDLSSVLQSNKTAKNNEVSVLCLSEGHKEFRRGNWHEAMELYNKSIRFAEIGSSNVAAAHKNRSKCFAKLKKVESTKQIKKMEYEINLKPKLSYADDARYPGMANVLQIKTNEQFGRHLVAKQDINVGETILFEKFTFFSNKPDHCVIHCMNCFKKKQHFIACPKCTVGTFCDEKCMNHDKIHKMLCNGGIHALESQLQTQVNSILTAINWFAQSDDLINMVETVLKENPDIIPTSCSSEHTKYHFYLKLNRSTSSLNNDKLLNVRKVYNCIMMIPEVHNSFNSIVKQRFLMHLCAHHYLVNVSNGFGGESNHWIALLSSLMNHSCAPNVFWSDYEDKSLCITIRPIKKGEQLFINYIGDKERSRQERKCELLRIWKFQCKCIRCEPQVPKHKIYELLSDPFFKMIIRDRHSIHKDGHRSILKKNCINCLKKYGDGDAPWSSELGLIISVFIDILLFELHV